MRFRTVLSFANLAAIVIAFVVLFEFPAYASYAFYALVAWIFIGFGLMYLPIGARTAATGPGTPLGGTFPGSAGPLPSGPGRSPPVGSPIDFCIWCGTSLPPGTTVCPSCGHRVGAI